MDNIPSISDRLSTLKPNSELLEFYRNRLSEYDKEHQDLEDRLSSFYKTCEQQHQLERDLQQKDREIATLQKGLSDIQACLFQEREHVLRLYAENDRLKIRELEDRKKIQKLLILCGERFPNADVAYILNDRPGLIIPQQLKSTSSKGPVKKTQDKNTRAKHVGVEIEENGHGNNSDPEILHLQIEALRAELEEKTRLSREHIEALTEDCNVTREEAESQRFVDSEKIRKLSNRLKKSQELLQQGLKDYIKKQGSMHFQERELLTQRDRLLLELEKTSRNGSDVHAAIAANIAKSKSQSQTSNGAASQPLPEAPAAPTSDVTSTNRAKSEMEALKNQLSRARRLSETYQSQCVRLEDQLARMREERDASQDIFKERSEKLSGRVQTLTTRYRDLERRHRLEVEGFRTDIKFLKTQMQNTEKQLLKAAVAMNQDEQDKKMLEAVHKNTKRSKFLSDQLRMIKMEIYNLEQDLRHL